MSSTGQFVCLSNWLSLYFPWCIVLVLTTCISGVLCCKHCISLWYSFWRMSFLSTSESSKESVTRAISAREFPAGHQVDARVSLRTADFSISSSSVDHRAACSLQQKIAWDEESENREFKKRRILSPGGTRSCRKKETLSVLSAFTSSR